MRQSVTCPCHLEAFSAALLQFYGNFFEFHRKLPKNWLKLCKFGPIAIQLRKYSARKLTYPYWVWYPATRNCHQKVHAKFHQIPTDRFREIERLPKDRHQKIVKLDAAMKLEIFSESLKQHLANGTSKVERLAEMSLEC